MRQVFWASAIALAVLMPAHADDKPETKPQVRSRAVEPTKVAQVDPVKVAMQSADAAVQAEPVDLPDPPEAWLRSLQTLVDRISAVESRMAGASIAEADTNEPLSVKIQVPGTDMVCGDLVKLKLEVTGNPVTIRWQAPEGISPETGERVYCTDADYEVSADGKSCTFSKRLGAVYRFVVAVADARGRLEMTDAEIELVAPDFVPIEQPAVEAPVEGQGAIVPLSETIARLLNQTPQGPQQAAEQKALAAVFRDEAQTVAGGGVAAGSDPMKSLESRVAADLGGAAANWSSFLAGLRQSMVDRQQHGELATPAAWAAAWNQVAEALQPG